MLDVRAGGCGPRLGFGTATLIDDTLALTAAHVVAGGNPVTVIDLDGKEHDARVVWFDPDLDLAALRIPAGIASPVELTRDDVDDIERGIVAVSRGAFADRLVTTAEVAVPRHVNVATTDIYLERDVMRPGFEVTGAIEPGDSGTMVVTSDGAAGVIWSRSNATIDRAWAVDVPEEFRQADFRRSLNADVDLGPCLR
jgi:S1-C subfamily serine protease